LGGFDSAKPSNISRAGVEGNGQQYRLDCLSAADRLRIAQFGEDLLDLRPEIRRTGLDVRVRPDDASRGALVDA
jgi:hypothetical protein